MTDKRGSIREVVITDGVTAGQIVIRSDTGALVVVPTTQSAASFATSIGAPSVKNVDLSTRVGDVYPDTGKGLFD
ncbi:MAG TPA: hypothetical protein VGY54_04035 [Polyangiaceae bacterium]|nr:hypothetical protein [Polyangiaceae bacterium]